MRHVNYTNFDHKQVLPFMKFNGFIDLDIFR